jgi:hypothetical protein
MQQNQSRLNGPLHTAAPALTAAQQFQLVAQRITRQPSRLAKVMLHATMLLDTASRGRRSEITEEQMNRFLTSADDLEEDLMGDEDDRARLRKLPNRKLTEELLQRWTNRTQWKEALLEAVVSLIP